MKRSNVLKILALIGMILCATNSFATPLEEIGVVPGQGVNVNISGFYQGGALAGMYDLRINGTLTHAYCIDYLQYSPTGPTSYDLVSLPTDLKYKQAAWIMQNYGLATNDYNQVVNAQVAIWEILSPDRGNLQSGNFSVQSWSGYGSLGGAQTIVNQVLSLSPSYFQNFDTSDFKLAYNGSYQDYLLYDRGVTQENPTPEPSTMLLLGGGLIGLLGIRKKS